MSEYIQWSEQLDQLYQQDNTIGYNIDRSVLNATVVADTLNQYNGKRITTIQAIVPWSVLCELYSFEQLTVTHQTIYDKDVDVNDIKFNVLSWNDRNDKPMKTITQRLLQYVWKLTTGSLKRCYKANIKCDLNQYNSNYLLLGATCVQCIITSTEWEHFLTQAYNHQCKHLVCLARMIYQCLCHSTVSTNQQGIHAAYIDGSTYTTCDELLDVIKTSAASIARIVDPQYQEYTDQQAFDIMLANNDFRMLRHIGIVPTVGRITKESHANLQRNYKGWYQASALFDTVENQKYIAKLNLININTLK